MKKFESLNASKFEALDNKAMGIVVGGTLNDNTYKTQSTTPSNPNCTDTANIVDDAKGNTISWCTTVTCKD